MACRFCSASRVAAKSLKVHGGNQKPGGTRSNQLQLAGLAEQDGVAAQPAGELQASRATAWISARRPPANTVMKAIAQASRSTGGAASSSWWPSD